SIDLSQEIDSFYDSEALAEKLNGVIEQLKSTPGKPAVAEFGAGTELVGGFQTKAEIRQFTLDVDEPPDLFGTDKGPNPAELVLAALGTCQEIVYSAYAAVIGIPLDSLKIRVKGKIDLRGLLNVAPVPAGFSDIDYDVEIKSPADKEQIRQLAELVNAHCPILDTLQRPINLSFSVVHNDERL
ncbi:MAG TPA: OsmC family protein, partial [Thermodesulfobacteriota bacterium]|nr:OsmC family protein [Thermodesulfobacteriota bacterium]